MSNDVWFVDVATAGEPAWAAAAVASSVMQDDRHNDRSHLVRQVISERIIINLVIIMSVFYIYLFIFIFYVV